MRGDVDTHENFEEILKATREHGIIPNFTTSGIAMTKEKAEICKKYCGAIAVSEHFASYTNEAIDMLLDAGVKTNIHYVLSTKTIDDAIQKLRTNSFKMGINAVVFLLYKPIGLGKMENILTYDICQFIEYSQNDMAKYLEKKYGVSRADVFAEVKKVNRRRKKLYDSEYITHVCKMYDLDPIQIASGWKTEFGSYREFSEKYL